MRNFLLNKIVFLPSLICISVAFIFAARITLLGGRWPVHFNAAGIPDGYRVGGYSQWMMPAIALALLFFLVQLDKLLVRAGVRRCNPSGAISGFMSGIMAGVTWTVYHCGSTGWTPGDMIWVTTFGAGGAAALVSYALEFTRRYPSASDVAPIPRKLEFSTGNWLYYDHSSIRSIDVLLISVVGFLVFQAFTIPDNLRLLIVVEISLMIFLGVFVIGGISVTINAKELRIAVGIFKIPIVRLKTSEVRSAERVKINALRDFGGFLWRPGYKKTGFITGNIGVRFALPTGKLVTVSVREPETMLAAIAAGGGEVGKRADAQVS